MTRTYGDPPITQDATVEAVVDATEALGFARDLGGSLTHVLVAAVGRALGRRARAGADGGVRDVFVAVSSAEQRISGVGYVPGARDAPLPEVRDAVDDAMADGGATTRPTDHSAILVVQRETPAVEAACPVPVGSAAVLEACPCDGDPLLLSLTLSADGAVLGRVSATELMTEIVRLVERPYRRLV
jgi:hypothetical protein